MLIAAWQGCFNSILFLNFLMFPSFSSHPLPSHRKIAVSRDGAASTKSTPTCVGPKNQRSKWSRFCNFFLFEYIATWKQHETKCLTFCWLYNNNTSRGYLGILLKTSKILVTWMSSSSLSYGKRYQSRNTSRSLASKTLVWIRTVYLLPLFINPKLRSPHGTRYTDLHVEKYLQEGY